MELLVILALIAIAAGGLCFYRKKQKEKFPTLTKAMDDGSNGGSGEENK